MTKQLEAWKGEFGTEYTARNRPSWESRSGAFRTVLANARDVRSVLEVGCNRGHNLIAIREVLGPQARLAGVEPNDAARAIARGESGLEVWPGTASAMEAESASFDLVFTAGVLIHIAPVDLDQVLREIHRVSRRYVLAIEYSAPAETAVPYRGHSNLLWKRDFGKRYVDLFPGLKQAGSGFLGAADGFDDCTWWLLEK